jgi:DNA primase
MAGRIVIPEIRGGQPIWLVGRTITDPIGDRQKYLGLPGPKPLLGWEAVADERMVVVVEGPFDWLTLRRWGYPSVALVGTHIRAVAAKALSRFERIYLALDSDEAGQTAAVELARTLGGRAVQVILPGIKDVGELALRPDGPAVFAHALQQTHRAWAA